jgi:F-type H+-transporting ATPase subunit c
LELIKLCALLGAAFSMGMGAVGAALGEGMIALNVVKSLARQPRAAGKLLRVMLIGQAITETPAVFALVISLLLIFQPSEGTFIKAVAFLIAGSAMGISTLASGLGTSLPSKQACIEIGRQPENVERLMLNMLVGQAITGTTVIYTMVIAMILIFVA